jgi:hypothetical protein
LSLRAVILGSVIVLPREYITVGGPPTGKRGSKVLVRQDPLESGELTITDLKTSLPWLEARAERLEQKRPPSDGLPVGRPGDYLLEVEAERPPEIPSERTRAQLSFKTGLKRQPEVTIPINIDLRPPVILSTKRLLLAPPADGEVTNGTILVSVRPGLNPGLLRAEASPDSLKVELEPAGSRRFKAHVSWDGGKLEGGAVIFNVGGESHELPVQSAGSGS